MLMTIRLYEKNSFRFNVLKRDLKLISMINMTYIFGINYKYMLGIMDVLPKEIIEEIFFLC
jgi:hypothetical protein